MCRLLLSIWAGKKRVLFCGAEPAVAAVVTDANGERVRRRGGGGRHGALLWPGQVERGGEGAEICLVVATGLGMGRGGGSGG